MQMKNPIFKVCFSLSLRFLLVLLLLPPLVAEIFFFSLSFLHMQRGWFLIQLQKAVHVLETTALISGSFSRFFMLFARLLYIFWSHQQGHIDTHTHAHTHWQTHRVTAHPLTQSINMASSNNYNNNWHFKLKGSTTLAAQTSKKNFRLFFLIPFFLILILHTILCCMFFFLLFLLTMPYHKIEFSLLNN